jgi:putative mRNA 3-end processing factor
MEVRFLGGAGEVGRSALLVNDRLLLDFGVKTGTPTTYPLGLRSVAPESVVVSHAHLDHAGALPTLMSAPRQADRPDVHWTPPTDELARLLARDTLRLADGYDCPYTAEDVRRLTEASVHHDYREPFEAAGHRVELFDAGHVPGSAHVLVDEGPADTGGDTRLLYTADFNTEDQQLLAGTTARPDADAVAVESTYAFDERAPRAEIETGFTGRVRRTLRQGGTVVVPAFAVGRTQEMMAVCARADIDCYVDGMGTRVVDLFRRHGRFLRDPDVLDRAASNARVVDGRPGQRERIAEQSTVVITTSGMLQGGPAMTYVPAVRSNPANLVALSGYQVEDTPGRDLLETGSAEIDGRRMPVAAQVEAFDFSAHADRSGLLAFLDDYREATVLVNHGDRCEAFAADRREAGFDARAPDRGETVTV